MLDTVLQIRPLKISRLSRVQLLDLVLFFLVVLAFLPYFKPIMLHVTLILYCLLYGLEKGRFPLGYPAFFTAIFFGVGALFAGGAVTSLNILILPIAISVFSRCNERTMIFAAKFSLMVYFLGLALEIVSPELPGKLVQGYRGSIDRGFRSFTSEPSFLGLSGLALLVFFLYFKEKTVWIALAFILIIASFSMTAIFPALIVYGVSQLKLKKFLHFVFYFLVVYALYKIFGDLDYRIFHFINSVSQNPFILLSDVSFSNRVIRAFSPLVAALHDNFMPHMFPDEGDIPTAFRALTLTADSHVDKLSNLSTIFLYVFGFLSFPIIGYFIVNARAPLFFLTSLLFFFFTNISTGVGYVFLLIALTFRKGVPSARPTLQKFQPIE